MSRWGYCPTRRLILDQLVSLEPRESAALLRDWAQTMLASCDRSAEEQWRVLMEVAQCMHENAPTCDLAEQWGSFGAAIDAIAEVWGVFPTQVYARNRSTPGVHARMVCYLFGKSILGMTPVQIAEVFDVSPSSVRDGIVSAWTAIETCPAERARWEKARTLLIPQHAPAREEAA